MKVIDVSSYQKITDFDAVRREGVQGAVLRSVIKSGKTDASFQKFYECFIAVGIPTAVYVFSYDLSYREAAERAEKVKKLIDGKDISFVALDLEWDRQRAGGKALMGAVIRAYLDVFEDIGIKIVGYWNLDWHRNVIPEEYKTGMHSWIARYPAKDNGTMKISLKPNAGESMWQYSSKGKVNGITGNVDMNECYRTELFNMTDRQAAGQIKNPYREPEYTLYRDRARQPGDQVRWLQWGLNRAGYCLAVDGIFGEATEDAVMDLQRRSGIAVDGKCGPVTKEKLRKALYEPEYHTQNYVTK